MEGASSLRKGLAPHEKISTLKQNSSHSSSAKKPPDRKGTSGTTKSGLEDNAGWHCMKTTSMRLQTAADSNMIYIFERLRCALVRALVFYFSYVFSVFSFLCGDEVVAWRMWWLEALTRDCALFHSSKKRNAGLNMRSIRNPLLHTSTSGSFSAVSTPIFASKDENFSIF